MNSKTVSSQGGWKDLALGIGFLAFVGTAFTGVVALASALFVGH